MLFTDTFITIYILVFTFIFGTVFGSFINCMAYRIAHKESVVKGRSHCATCNHPLAAKDLVPIFSYIFLKGKCRYCGEKISPRYMLTELFTGIAFVSIVLRFDVSVLSLRYIILICLLLALSLVDLEIYEIPDRFIVTGIVVWLISIPFLEGDIVHNLLMGLLGGVAVGGGMLLISLIFDKVLKKESMGGGDIKLYFMVSLYLGLAVGLFNLILSCVVGIFFVFVMKKNRIPFGPAISIATWISLLCGSMAVNWYIGLL